MRFLDKSFDRFEAVFERVWVILRIAVNRAVVDKGGRSRFSLSGVDVGIGKSVFFEPVNHLDAELSGRYS